MSNRTEPTDRELAAAQLRWHAEIGVDETLGNEPVNRFAPEPAGQPQPADPVTPVTPDEPRRQPAPHPVAEDAHAAARAASTHDELLAAIRAFDGCALKRTATTTCICDGNPSARIMLIGEAPGSAEDRQGKPFVGPSGMLLDRMLATIGLDRTSTYITNTIFWRPPGNRTPTAEEVALCLPFVERQIELIRPELLVYIGATALKAMVKVSPGEGITRLRGRWMRLEQPDREPIPAIAMFHPAYLLRQPGRKRDSWQDLQAIREKMTELGIAPETPAPQD